MSAARPQPSQPIFIRHICNISNSSRLTIRCRSCMGRVGVSHRYERVQLLAAIPSEDALTWPLLVKPFPAGVLEAEAAWTPPRSDHRP